MPNKQPDSPSGEIIAGKEMARISTLGSDSADEVSRSTKLARFLRNNFGQIRFAFLLCLLTLLLSFVLSQAYQRYAQITESRHVFYSTTSESFAVIASDQQRTLASFVAPNRLGVALPEEPFEVPVEASLRLGYRKWIYPSRWNYQSQNAPYEHDLSPPASSIRSIENVIWHESISADNVGPEKYLVLRPQGLSLINVTYGAIDWTFVDPDEIQWGNCTRGEASTFQPDRFTIGEINDNGTVRYITLRKPPSRLSWLNQRPRESEYISKGIAWKSSLSTRMASTAVVSKGTVSDPVDLICSKSPYDLDFMALHEYFEERFGKWDEFCNVAPSTLHPPKTDLEDPRLECDLPWVKMAQSMVWQEYTRLPIYPLRLLASLTIFLFVLPAIGLWSLFRRRFTLRALIAVGITVALACLVYLYDQRAYPGVNPYEANVIMTASSLVLYLFFFCVPLYTFIRGRWRRKVAVGLFAIVAVALVLLDTFVDAPRHYELPVVCRWLDWVYLSYLFFALIPSGVLLSIVLIVGWLFRLIKGRSRPTSSG